MTNFKIAVFVSFCLMINCVLTNAQNEIVNTTTTATYKVYNFPPPMDDPSFPFKVVTVDETTPEWAKMIYQVNPNMAEARKLYFAWKEKNPDVKNGHTRNFRKLSGYLAQNKYINEVGFIDIPTNEEVKAESAKILRDRAKFKRQQNQSAARNSTNNTTWELLGPTFKKTTSGNLVDRHINVYSITQSLSNKDILYCATESGGTVFKTTNHGDSWFSVSDNLITSMGARNIEVAPSNPDIVYLCTRDDVFKTTTGNDNWVSVYNDYKSNNRTLIIHPTNPDMVLTGGDNGILKTIDGGANWTNPLPSKSIYDLRYKPGDTQIIYALVKNSSTNLTEFYKSTDAGETWTIRTTGWPMEAANSTNGGQMTTSDGNDNYIYAFIGATWTAANNSENIKIMKSIDYGESWTTAVDYDNDFGINSGQGYYDWDIEMSDTNPDVVYGGTQGRWVTKDGFQTTNQDIGSLGHADVQETLFNGTDLWVVNDGGIILFDDENFQNYTPKSIGLNAISYWSFDQGWNKDVSSATHYHNGTSAMSENYEDYVGVNFGGAEPSFSLVAQPSGDKIVSKGYGSVNGYTMPETQDGVYNRFSYNLTPNTHSYSGNNVGVHPLAYETHFLGVENALLKSEDFGVTWDTLYKFPFADENVWDIELTRANTDAIFVTTIYSGGGNLYRSLDGGKSFTEIPLPSQFSNNPTILNAAISNEDANTFYVMGDRYGIKIAKTVDGGATWIDLDTPTLDPYDGHKIMQADGTDGGIYLLTTRAVFYRNNTLTDWAPLVDGMPANTSYQYIRPFYRDKELRIATSRGVYEAELYDTPQLSNALLQPIAQKIKTDCARDTFYFDDFSVVEHAGATWSWSFPGASYVSATNISNPKVVFGQSGQFDVTMSITKNGQIYTKTVEKMITVGNGCREVDEIAGNALQLNRATNDRAITEDFKVTTNTFTFSAWIKPTESFQGFQGIFSNGVWCAHCNDETIGLIMNYWGDRLYYRWPGSTSSWSGASNLYPKLDEWSYVAFVMSPDKVTLYLNEEKWESNISHDPATINQLYLGFGHYTKYFNGQIEEATFWKKSLTEQEIKELMHLTKDPTIDPDLLAYYQFNEAEGLIFDKAGTAPARLLGEASRVTSSAPVGGGASSTALESGGNIAFGTTDFEANFTNQSGVEVVASKINQLPYNLNGLLAGEAALASEYWAIHRYGSGDFTASLTFKTSEDLTSAAAAIPSQFALYKRGNRSDEDWVFVGTATSVDATTDKITFATELQEWGQYFIAKSTQAIMRANSDLVLKNTAVGGVSPEKSYQLTAANLTEDILITAPVGYQLSATSSGDFTNTLVVFPTNGVIETTIYVQFTPTEARTYNAAIIHTSTGASDMLVDVSAISFELDRFPGTALDLDGSSDYVNLGNPTELQITDDLTIQMWVKPANFSARRNPIGKAYGGEYTITQNTDGTLTFYNGSSGSNSGSYQQTSANHALVLNEWQHLTVVRDMTSRTVKWYINGVQTNERTSIRTDIAAGTNSVFIGEGYVSGYAGLIDEVRIWKQALSATEVREQLHLTLKGTEDNLVAYYQFNETSGDAIDRINGLNGTFVNQATRSLATEPVGGGYANTQTAANGITTFTNTGLEANFTSQNGAEIVASKLALAPNDIVGIGANETAADNQYWVVNRYGAGAFEANLTFTLAEDLTNAEATAPTTLKLYGRNQTSDGDWTLISTANTVDATTNKITFNSITAFEQYLITRSPYPKIAINQIALAFGNVDVNATSELTYTVSATDLSNDLILTPPVGFDISLTTETGFISNPNTLTITNTGIIVDTTIYVRFNPANTNYQSGLIEHSSNGATNKQVTVGGVGVQPEIAIRQAANIIENNNTIDFGSHQVGQDSSIIFTIKNENLGTLNLSGTPIIEVVGANAIDFSVNTSSTATILATGATTTFDIKFNPTTAGTKSANISIVNNDGDEAPYIINLTGIGEAAPAIMVSSLADFSNQLVGTASTVQSYTVAGTALIADVILTSTPGFEISLNENSGFGNSLTLKPSDGSLNNIPIYVRFAPEGVADYNGVIKHVSTDAVTQAVTINGSSSKVAETTPGKAIAFNGTSDYVSIPNQPIFQFGTSTDFTVALWMKTDNWQNDASIASNKDWDSGSRDSWNLALATDGKGIDVNVGDGSNRADLQAGDLNDGHWHYIAATFDRDGAVSLYVDGVLEQSTSMAHVGDINSGLPVTFGRDSENEYFFDGMIDEAKIWNAALSAQEVREAMHVTAEWNTPNLIAYYQFNETNYGSVFNLTGSSHGTIYSGNRIVSTAPVGGGIANTQTEANGDINFINTDFEANFSSQNNAAVVVSKINLAPNVIPTDVTTVFDQQYWAVHRYGTGSFAGEITFKVAEDLTDFYQNNPNQILLYGRAANSDTTWQFVSTASTVDAANDKATFNNITTFDQYVLASLVTDFTADKTGTCLTSSIQFTDASDGMPTTWAWTFEGGTPSTSTAQNPSITYNSSGTYDVNLVIDNGLATQRTITKSDFITVANELVPSIMATKLTICLGESVELTASGGMTYQWGTNATLNTITGATVTATPITTTTYMVTATDAAGCTGTQSIEIIVNPLPTASLSGTTILCQGATNPNLTFTGANGTAPYTFTYQINDGVHQTIVTASGNSITLAQSTETAGTFVYKLVSVTDANGCAQQQNGTATITVSALPTASVSGTTTICENETAPMITFAGANGIAPYTFTYKINDGNNQNITTTSGNEIALSQATTTAGTFIYTLVQVTDANGCAQIINGTATVTINELPSATMIGSTGIYQNATSPNITFTGSNGVAPYTFTYQINDGTNQTVTTTTGNIVKVAQPTTDLGVFSYTLTSVMDANNCEQTATGSVIISVNALPTAGISGTTTICQNEASPEILFTSDQGVAPYTFTYKVNNGLNQTVTTTTGGSVTVAQPTTVAGDFVYELISIADANNGSQAQSGTATVTVNPLPTATISGTTSLCKDAPATLVTFIGANGTAPYTFTYTVNGGSAQTITTSTGDMVTLEQATGSAGTFTYTLVSVSDATTCSQNQSGIATITINELPTATITGTTSVYNNDASPVLTFTGTTGVAPYTFTYTINGGANQTVMTTTGNTVEVSQSTSEVGEFVYQLVSVTDSNNCSQNQSDMATITVNALPTAGISGTTTVCLNATTPEIIFTSNEGTAPYTFTYTINEGPNQSATTTLGNSVAVAQSTTTAGIFRYELVSIADANNASQPQSGAAVITVGSLPTANISGSTAVCQNSENPVVRFTGSNGIAPYTFTFTVNDGAEKTVTTTVGDFIEIEQDASETGVFSYALLSVEDVNGCAQNQTGSAVITVNALPNAAINTTTTNAFRNDPEPEVVLTGTDGKAPYTFVYTINDGANQTITSNAEGTATISQPTTTEGTFTYILNSVTDANNCTQIQSGISEILIDAPPVPIAEINGNTTVCQNASAPEITFIGNEGSAPYTFTYKINNGANQTISTVTGNQVSVPQPTTNAGTFTYTLVSVADTNYPAQNQTGTASVIVNSLPTATISGTTNVCKDASATLVTFTGATGTAPYTFTYTINGGSEQTITTSTGNIITLEQATVNTGTFTYTLVGVADATTCHQPQTGTAIITINELPTATISGTTTLCKDAPATLVTFTGANGTVPYTFTYTINGGSEQTITTSTGNTVTLEQATGSAGIFTYALVNISDATTCNQDQNGTATITINELPTATISGTTAVYNNDDAPALTFTGANGVAPYTFTYTINDGENQTITTTTGNTVAVNQSTSEVGNFVYKLVSVSDNNSCIQTQNSTVTITVNALSTAGISGTTTVCLNETAPEITFTGNEGTAPYTFTYKINNGENQTVTTTSGNGVTVAQPTTTAGIFRYELVGIADANNAFQNQSGTAVVTVQSAPNVIVYPGNTSFCLGQSITVKAEGATSYTWSPTEDLSAATGPTILITPMQTTTYQVIGTGENGCKDTVDFTITVDEDCCPEGNLVAYENTSNLPTLTHTSDYIIAGNLNGNGDVTVENEQNVTFKSNNYIQLEPGFYAKGGADFQALIEGCTNVATLVENIPTTERVIPTIGTPTVIESQEVQIKVYPNPFATNFTVDYVLPTDSQVSIHLVDMLGRNQQVLLTRQNKSAGTHQILYQNRDLGNGIYFLVIQVGEELIQRKIVLSVEK